MEGRDSSREDADDRKGDRKIGKGPHPAGEFLGIAQGAKEL
jgi:hypothetical protein